VSDLDTLRTAQSPDLESVDLVLRLLEHLAASPAPRGVSEVARELCISKPRAHRHLRALVQRGYASQHPHQFTQFDLAQRELVRAVVAEVSARPPSTWTGS